MEKKIVKKNVRHKAFIGAIIGGIAGTIGGIISAGKKRKAEEAAFKAQQKEQYRLESVQQAGAMTSSLSNQNYVDEYQDKVTLKAGGKMKVKKNNSSDRMTYTKKYAMGGKGRRKAEDGIDVGKEAGDAIGGIGGLVTSLFTKPTVPKTIKKMDGLTFDKKTSLVANSYQVDANGNPIITPKMPAQPNEPGMVQPIVPNTAYKDRIAQVAKMGKRYKSKSNR